LALGDFMTIVGFGFTKLNVERKGVAKGKISIKNNINVKNVTTTDLSLGKNKEAGLVFTFEFKSVYEPDIADISIEGEVIFLEEAKKVKEVLDKWKKDGKVEGEILGDVLNTALSKSNVQALIMSRDLNIPAPFPLPKVGIKKPE
jgi:predicted acyltransferase (DUF342 family)